MQTAPVVLDDLAVDVTREDVWRALLTRRRLASLDAVVTRMREEACSLAAPKAVYRYVPVTGANAGSVWLEGGDTIKSDQVAPYFQGADVAVAMVVTIGPGVEGRVQELFSQGQFMEAVVLDAAGSALTTATFRRVHELVHKELHDCGLSTGACLEPGSTYWNIEGQKLIFAITHAEAIGVKLMDSCFMMPRKSQSTIMPAGRELVVKVNPTDSYCRMCKVRGCLARRM